ncbi:hypothetical protein CEXT_604281 [Caerostris extrusa]|uniref:Uncharacterized protein n=1 Tax=Caerostris extrusa TaxID=172846 RepID=A0AAV4TEJ3_CAEEX|nr:hypothetical protein CEXT_604281 [Caerostris extrusa]
MSNGKTIIISAPTPTTKPPPPSLPSPEPAAPESRHHRFIICVPGLATVHHLRTLHNLVRQFHNKPRAHPAQRGPDQLAGHRRTRGRVPHGLRPR